MSLQEIVENLVEAFRKTTYGQWMKKEGLPIVEGFGLKDVREVELAPWPRLGGRGAFVQLYGMMDGSRSMYVAQIPPGGALSPERHLYEELICILEGRGATEIWQEGGRKQIFEWEPWSLFSPPLNVWHRLVNGSREPVRLLMVTNAPLIMNALRDMDFIFNCPYVFSSRYAGEEDFFTVSNKRYQRKAAYTKVWETNLISNIKEAGIDPQERKGSGVKITQFEMSGNTLIGHLSEWPEGRYHKAHYHGPGALLLGLESNGYVLMWSKDFGTHPYSEGHRDMVVEMDWKEGSVYSPLDNWFHQHFNTGPRPARHLAIRYGSDQHGHADMSTSAKLKRAATLTSMREGGTLIEYEDEDPEVRIQFEAALKRAGVACEMPRLTKS
jgi:oxalate decarboxylase/phosphoglucose isomerase-like protein (cupin superfamily)